MAQLKVLTTAVAAMGLVATTALAVKPAAWTHEQPKDFLAGKLDNVVVNTHGEVTLGRQTKLLIEAGDDAEAINALARAGDGKVYAATGPEGVIYQIDGDKVTKFATLPDGGTGLSLLFTRDGLLLVGTGGGEQAKIYVIDGQGKVKPFYEPKGAKYVWAMARGAGGEVYAATGVEGQLYRIEPDGKEGKVLVDLKPKNLLCLAFGPDGLLYAGTDEDGLIYRVNTESGKTFVMYDAKEAEISSIVVDEEGVIYAATAAAERARPGRLVADKPGGKPEEAGATTKPKSASSKPADAKPDEEKPAESKPAGPAKKPAAPPGAEPVGGEGNAIYRIDTNGVVTEVFREPVIVFGLSETDGSVLASTGNEGRVYSITPAGDEKVVLAKLESNQATTILRLPSGDLLVGTANPAKIARISPRCAEKGTLTSKPMDAGQIVKWGRMQWNATVPTGTKLTIATRSSNVEDEESESWDEWTEPMDATAAQQVASAGARFLQYRLTFETTVPEATPVLRRLEIARIEENRAPRVPAIEVLPAREEAEKPGSNPKVKMVVAAGAAGGEQGTKGPDHFWVIKWLAQDPNGDAMEFEVFCREAGAGRWIRLEKELKEPLRIWDTRTVPDGKYEVKVTASDAPANPPGTALSGTRVSDTIAVDNTAPEVKIDRAEVTGKSVQVRVTAVDALTPILGGEYSVDSSETWFDLAADDDIFDSMSEASTFTINDLEPGEHRIAVRVADRHFNMTYVTQSVNVGG